MNTQKNILITRSEIASWLGCSERMVEENERRWGLDAARRDLNKRNVRYHQDVARRVLALPGRPLN